ncbi:MAG: hypothetical protein HYV16_14605 [Gammaproteobacteria bacterium]|nr:hypothetical protein [Gammaproteobacteria bacterium]
MPTVSLRPDGILRIDYGLHPRISVESVRYARQRHLELTPHACPVLITGEGAVRADADAERYVGSPDVAKLTLASALVTRSLVAQLAAKLFLMYRKPLTYPVQAFLTEDEAVAWLRGFLPPESSSFD